MLALVGAAPFVAFLLLRTPWVARWVDDLAANALRERGVSASYTLRLSVAPLAVVADDVVVQSTDGGAPALVAKSARATPRVFALLSGRLLFDEIDVDAPHLRLAVTDGRVTNLDTSRLFGSSGATHAEARGRSPEPTLRALHLRGASLDIAAHGAHLEQGVIDVDATADSPSRFTVRVHARDLLADETAADGATFEDTLCSLDAAAHVTTDGDIDDGSVDARGVFDLDVTPGTRPTCVAAGDPREATLSLDGARFVHAPLAAEAHLRAHVPVALFERVGSVRQTAGWLGADLDVRYDGAHPLPQVHGDVEARELEVGQFRLARALDAEVSIDGDDVKVSRAVAHVAGGAVTLTDVLVRPLAPGVPLRATVHVEGCDLAPLLQELGVHPSPHVAWALQDLYGPLLEGTLAPFALAGEIEGHTGELAVYDAPYVDDAKKRIIGLPWADIATRMTVTADAIAFDDARARLPHGAAKGARVRVGFHGGLDVDVPEIDEELGDGSSLATLPIAGRARVSISAHGAANDPLVQGQAQIDGFVFGGAPLGDVHRAHFALLGDDLEISGLEATKNESAYTVRSLEAVFGGAAGIAVDAEVDTKKLELADLFALDRLETNPVLSRLEGTIVDGHAEVRFAVGGPADACGAGALRVRAEARIRNGAAYGQAFDEAAFDGDLGWPDRDAGLRGADVIVSSLSVRKGGGMLFGSGEMKDGAFDGRLAAQSVALSDIEALRARLGFVQGEASGMVAARGTFDAPVVLADARVDGVRLRGVSFGPSRLHVALAPPALSLTSLTPPPRALASQSPAAALLPHGGTPRCRAPARAPALAEGTRLVADGSFAGGQVKIPSLVLTLGDDPHLHAVAVVDQLDLDELGQLATAPPPGEGVRPPASVQGALSGTLVVEDLPLRDPSRAVATFTATDLHASYAGDEARLHRVENVSFSQDTATLPKLELDVHTTAGQTTRIALRAEVANVFHAPTVDLEVGTPEVDLSSLVGLLPGVQRASGHLVAEVSVEGPLAAPRATGTLVVRDATLGIAGLPDPLEALSGDVVFDDDVVSLRGATATLGGGRLTAKGTMPLRGRDALHAHLTLSARAVSTAPMDGMHGTFDGSLQAQVDAVALARGHPAAVQVTGDVTAESLSYTRDVGLTTDITAFGAHAARTKRTDAPDSTDPSRDVVRLDVALRTRTPILVHDDLLDARLLVAGDVVALRGGNHHVVFLGALKALPGGHVHLRGTDFDLRSITLTFDDPYRLDPTLDLVATTDYRRNEDFDPLAANGVAASGGPWHVTVHAYGPLDDPKLALSSDPPLADEDIALLLAVGFTRAELDLMQAQAGAFTQSAAFAAIASFSGADRLVKEAFPIDDFCFGSGWDPRTLRIEPEVTLGKRLGPHVEASVIAGIGEDRELRSRIEWRLARPFSLDATYDDIAVLASPAGNLGGDASFRVEFR